MMAREGKAQKTIRHLLEYRPSISEWFASTWQLFNRVAAFYFDVIQAHPNVLELSNPRALTALEKLTHRTKKNPDPVMPLTDVATNIPAMFRRAAIHIALGSARSFHSNLERWKRQKAKAEAQGRRVHKHPPLPPRTWNRSVTFYAGMWKQRVHGCITLKLWDGKTWRWVRFRLSGRDLPEGWEAKSPQVVRRGLHWWLHTPVEKTFPRPEKAEKQVKTHPDLRICDVDLNINDALAVCTIRQADGTVVATRFIRGGRRLHGRRKRLLGRVARNRRRTGLVAEGERDNADLWAKIRNWDEDTAHRVSRRIVEFAQGHGAAMITFEHLGKFRPEKGQYSRRANSKRSYWLRGRIFRYTRYKAWECGILTCRVNPRDTSRRCGKVLPDGRVCGHEVARYGEGEPPTGYRPGAPLYYCPGCSSRGNADRNASLNIGHTFFARYVKSPHQEKPLARSFRSRSPKGEGVSLRQDAQNGSRPHTGAERHGERDRHGTACREWNGAACAPDGIPRPLRPQWGSGHAAITLSAAYAGVSEEAAAL